MSTGTTIAIICFAVAAAVVLIALLWALVSRQRRQRRSAEAEQIRGQAEQDSHDVLRREALADETAAKARAAKAEADVKAAQAANLRATGGGPPT